jgi:hypothetical protein
MSNGATTPVTAGPKSIRSQEFRDIYCNQARIGASPFDFSITFSKIIEPTAGVNILEDQCVVRMSPQQFKNIIDYATKALDAWEESFGVIQTTTKLQSADVIKESFRKLKEAVNK